MLSINTVIHTRYTKLLVLNGKYCNKYGNVCCNKQFAIYCNKHSNKKYAQCNYCTNYCKNIYRYTVLNTVKINGLITVLAGTLLLIVLIALLIV